MALSNEILAALNHPVLVIDEQNVLVFINDQARQILGLPRSEPLSLSAALKPLARANGRPVQPDDFNTPSPLAVRTHPDSAREQAFELRCTRLSDGGRCLELLPAPQHAGVPLDALTGLMERGQMLSLIGMKRQRGKGALVLIDIDRLKIINDYLGYHTGDRVIHELGHAFRRQLPPEVLLARWSGHEFMALVPETLIARTAEIADQFNHIAHTLPLAKELNLPGGQLSLSVGFTRFAAEHSHDAARDPLTEVNAAVYEAKRAGRNRSIDAQHLSRPSIYITGGTLETALVEERILAAVQPIVDLKTRQIVADESLARMVTPEGRIIAAGEFIEAASALQLAHRIDHRIIKQTINYCVTSHFSLPRAHFVNISGDFLRHPELIDDVIVTAMTACGCTHPDQPGDRKVKPLVIEMTERELVYDIAEAFTSLKPLVDFGLRLALDDFGSGYSSYRYLLDLPFHFLKIEGELVRHVTTNPKARKIVQHIQQMASDMELTTVAEFIGDEATAQCLADMGVDWGQGFYLGKPELIHNPFSPEPTTRQLWQGIAR
ncbi:EAL domain-containing protein [Halothiobacillus sp. DCM-1]|uniref:EAL domain-containing protein n=1 Tax=Halothiobacillus sp. DCM-1 TaxID=3112558 RepID=UPI003243B055